MSLVDSQLVEIEHSIVTLRMFTISSNDNAGTSAGLRHLVETSVEDVNGALCQAI